MYNKQRNNVNNNYNLNDYTPSFETNELNGNDNTNLNDIISSRFSLPPSLPSHPLSSPQQSQAICAAPYTPTLFFNNNSNNPDINLIPNINSNGLNATNNITLLNPGSNITSHGNNNGNKTLMLSISYHVSMIRDHT